jgi:hypothetical protein
MGHLMMTATFLIRNTLHYICVMGFCACVLTRTSKFISIFFWFIDIVHIMKKLEVWA